MKKLIALLLVLAMAFGLVACGGSEAPAATEAPKADAPAAEAPAADAPAYAHPLQDPRVRQALWYAIDIDAIVEGLWDNTVVAAKKSLVPEGTWQADGLTEYSYNPDLAKQLLAEAGWDGSYTIEAVYYTANLLDTITAIQAMWAEVGVKMEFQLLTDNLTALLWTPSADGVTSAVDWDICFAGTNALTLGEFYNRHHSTAANNPTLKRYVQPSDNAPDRDEWLKKLGVNTYKNDWNHIVHRVGMNCWIGKLADGTVTTVQTMPWDFKPWGCGAGNKGSLNNGWIQFEICEDGLTDKNYFEAVYKEACEITAYLCEMFDIDPKGTVDFNTGSKNIIKI